VTEDQKQKHVLPNVEAASPRLALGLGIFAILVWGAGPIATSYAVDQIDPATVGVLRTVLAASILLPIALISKLPLPANRHDWILITISGLGGFIGFTVIYSIGQRHTTTSHAALILGASPVFTGLFGFIMQRAWPRRVWWVGAMIAMMGVTILILSRSGASNRGSASLYGDLLILASVLCSSSGYAAGGRLAGRIGSWSVTAWGISLAGIVALPILLFRLPHTEWGSVGTSAWAGVIYSGIVVSIIGYVAYYRAIGIAGVARIAPLQFAQPALSLVFAVILFDDHITLPILAAMLVILAGMTITRRASRSG